MSILESLAEYGFYAQYLINRLRDTWLLVTVVQIELEHLTNLL